MYNKDLQELSCTLVTQESACLVTSITQDPLAHLKDDLGVRATSGDLCVYVSVRAHVLFAGIYIYIPRERESERERERERESERPRSERCTPFERTD